MESVFVPVVSFVTVVLLVVGVVSGAGLSSRLWRALWERLHQFQRDEGGEEAAGRGWSRLKWLSLCGGLGGGLLLYEFQFSVLGGLALVGTSTALAGLLFAFRRERYARSYTYAGARQRREAARRRAAHRQAERQRRRSARGSGSAGAAAQGMPGEVRRALHRLGLPDDATREEVQSAYRQQAKRHHPDRYAREGEAVQLRQKERFQEVQEARTTLERYYA